MALREESFGTVGSRIFDVLRWADVTGKELAEGLGEAEATISRLRRRPDDKISVGVVQFVAEFCQGRGILSHVKWSEIRGFILDGDPIPGPEYLVPSEAPSGGGGRVVPLNKENQSGIGYIRSIPFDLLEQTHGATG